MAEVWLESFERFRLTSLNAPSKRHPLQRRMTNLQKAMIGVFELLETQYLPTLSEDLSENKLDLSFTTTFGELKAIKSIADGILAKDLPVSPLSFQHSVNNAAAGYLGMIVKNYAGACVTGTGILSLDKALFRIHKTIQAFPEKRHILIHCDEFLSPKNSVLAQAHGFIFGSEFSSSPNTKIRLETVLYQFKSGTRQHNNLILRDQYPKGPFSTFSFPDDFQVYERISEGYGCERLISRWTKSSFSKEKRLK